MCYGNLLISTLQWQQHFTQFLVTTPLILGKRIVISCQNIHSIIASKIPQISFANLIDFVHHG